MNKLLVRTSALSFDTCTAPAKHPDARFPPSAWTVAVSDETTRVAVFQGRHERLPPMLQL